MKLTEIKLVCGICHCRVDQADDVQVDHIIPRSKGGPEVAWNERVVHAACNMRKRDHVVPVQIPMLVALPSQHRMQRPARHPHKAQPGVSVVGVCVVDNPASTLAELMERLNGKFGPVSPERMRGEISGWANERARQVNTIVAEEGGIRPAARKLGISAARVHQIISRLPKNV